MKIIPLIFSLLFPAAALAITPLPPTTDLQLEKPVAGETDYVDRLNQNADTLDAAILDKRVGGTITGDLIITGSYVGDGSFLTGVPSGITFTMEDFTASCDGLNTVFTISTSPMNNGILVVLDGLTQQPLVDWNLSGADITMATAPAANTSSFVIYYATAGASSGVGGGGGTINVLPPIIGSGTVSNPLALNSSSVTMLGASIDPTEVPLLASKLQADQLSVSTGSLQAQINSMTAGSTVFVDSPILGNGGTGNHLRLDSSSVTLRGNAFNNANQLVQLDVSTQLPVAGGANLTNLNASNLASGTLSNARLDSSSVTLRGNAFNGASQLVQLSAGSALPAVNGASLTSLNASQLASGTVPNARLDSTSVTLQGNSFNGASQLVQLSAGSALPAVNGAAVTAMVVSTSVSYTAATSIAVLTDVSVATGTLTVRGGRPLMLMFTSQINNSAGAARTYTIKLKADGVTVSPSYTMEIPAGSNSSRTIHALLTAGLSAGARTITATINTNNVTGTQETSNRELSSVEF